MSRNKAIASADVHLSKSLSWLLRHGAVKENLPIQSDGFLDINVILLHRTFRNYKFEDIRGIVENDIKNRYTIVKCPGSYKIKANQGHSLVEINNLSLRKIVNPEDIPIAVHGTYKNLWNNIKTQGLKKFSRNHIHFTDTDKPEIDKKYSGFRENAEILIYVDTKKMLEAGIEIFVSENGVILSSGQDGVIKPKFFSKVIDRKTNTELQLF